MKRNGNGKLWVYPLFLLYPSEGSPSSKFISSPPQHSGSPSKAWFLGSLKGFFGSRRPSTPQSSPTRQRSTKTTASATIITAVFNNRNLTSGDDSDIEDTSSPSKSSKGSRYCSVNPLRSTKQRNSMGNGKSGQTTISVRSSRRGDTFDGAPPARRGVGLRIAVGVVKDVGVVGPIEVPVTVYLGAGLRDSGGQQKQRSLMRGPAASDVGASSRGAAYDCAYACCALGSCGSWWKEARENTRWNGSRPTADVCVCICSSHSPDVAYEVPLGITSDRFGLLSTTTTYTVTTNSNPGWLIWM